MTALPTNLVPADVAAKPARGLLRQRWFFRLPTSLRAPRGLLASLVSVSVHAALVVGALVCVSTPQDQTASSLFRKGDSQGQDASAVTVTMRFDGDGRQRNRMRLKDAMELVAPVPPSQSATTKVAANRQAVREALPAASHERETESPASVDPSQVLASISRPSSRPAAVTTPRQPVGSALSPSSQVAPARPPNPSAGNEHESSMNQGAVSSNANRASRADAAALPGSALAPRWAEVEISTAAPTWTKGGADSGEGTGPRSAATAGVPDGAADIRLPTTGYPPESRRTGEQGTVVLEVQVLADGRAGEIRVIESPGYPRLVDAAIKAVRKAHFRGAIRTGQPTPNLIRVPIHFEIK